jgi:hypothetical protein
MSGNITLKDLQAILEEVNAKADAPMAAIQAQVTQAKKEAAAAMAVSEQAENAALRRLLPPAALVAAAPRAFDAVRMKQMLILPFIAAPSKLTEAASHNTLCAWTAEQREAAPPWATARILWGRPPGGAPPFPLELLEAVFGDFLARAWMR